MPMPKAVADIIFALRQERIPLASRLDAIDLAIDNLNRVYGIHGEQPALVERRREKKARKPRTEDGNTAAMERRTLLLSVIRKAPHGVTALDLKRATPNMDPKDRANALSVLKAKGEVKRAGNTWLAAA